MNKLLLYTKTYKEDLERVKNLIESVKLHNKDNIPYYISIPKLDKQLFLSNIDSEYVNIVFDEDICGISNQSWHTQQIIKSSFWKLGVCENYVMIDSDSYFIKDFYTSDFLYDENTPYTVVHEQRDLFEWSSRYSEYIGKNPKTEFMAERLKIMELLNRSGKVYDFGPSPVIWSSRVWKELDAYLLIKGRTFSDLIKISASEFSWYGEFLLKNKVIDMIPIGPLFKVFHYNPQYRYYKQLGYTEEMFSQNYLGIVMQSNFSKSVRY
jgi:hypothetical protein